MRVKFTVILVSTIFVIACAHRATAESRWSNTTGGTFDWNSSGNWSGTFPPGTADDVRITNDLSAAQLITNMGSSVGANITNAINFLAISNGLGSASVTVQQGAGLFRSNFGLQIGKNATLILTTNALIGTNQNLTFDLRPGGQAGTLILSNASPTSGFTAFVNNGGANGIVNGGTIQFSPVNNQMAGLNYGQTLAFTNNVNGTVVMNGTGTGAFTGNFGTGGNRAFVNSGTIFARSGTLRIDSRDAFSRGGFQNTATGFIQVDSGAVFEIRRTTNAWVNGPAVTNSGTVFMNGGNLVMVDLDGTAGNSIRTNASRSFVNQGTIEGTGTFTASIVGLSGGIVSPGPGIGFGTLNDLGNVSIGSNSTLSIQLGLLGQSDLLAVTSNLTLNANSILNLAGGAIGNVYTVATAFAVSGTFGSVTPNYTVTYDPTDIRVQFVPEPSTLLLAACGLLGLVALRRRSS